VLDLNAPSVAPILVENWHADLAPEVQAQREAGARSEAKQPVIPIEASR
jgi:hypothetical protein